MSNVALAYRKHMVAAESQRSFEARILRQVNYALRRSNETQDKIELARAVMQNHMIWQTFLWLVLDETNTLPIDLRRSLAIVAKSVLKEIDDNPIDKIDIDFLISVNDDIATGLGG